MSIGLEMKGLHFFCDFLTLVFGNRFEGKVHEGMGRSCKHRDEGIQRIDARFVAAVFELAPSFDGQEWAFFLLHPKRVPLFKF